MDRGPNHLSRFRSRSPHRARRSINVDDVAEDQLRDVVVRGQQEWRRDPVRRRKLWACCASSPGAQPRDQYERAIDDSELYRDSTQMTRVLQHRLQNQELGLQQVACNVSTVSGTVDDLRREVLMSTRNTGSTAGLARAIDGITEEVQDIDRKLEMLFTTIIQDFDKKLQGLHKSVVEDIRKDIFKLAEGLNTSTPKSVPSAALVEAATTDLASAGAVKPALTVNTMKKTKKVTLSKSKAKSRFATALEKKVKEMGVDAERYGA
ncbi:hypothetical protein PF011_g30467, partial [Phytophthora fragariae]